MQIIDKYDYCQQCHLLKSDCRCDAEVKAVVLSTSTVTEEPIYTSTWTIDKSGIQKKVKGIVVKGNDLHRIKHESTYLNRVKRELGMPMDAKLSVINVELDLCLT